MRDTSLNKSKLAREIKKHVLQQINDKKEKNLKKKEIDRAIPDIEGDMGYPPRPQLTKDELREIIIKGNKKMGQELKEQMKLNEEARKKLED